MIINEIYSECIKELNANNILFCSRKNEEKPFGYVIDYIKDMYNISKTESWDTAKAICQYFNLA